MPLLVFVWGFIGSIIPHIVKQIFVALGISVVTYGGITVLFTAVESQLDSYLSAIPADTLVLIGLSGFGVFIKMQIAAYTAVLAIRTFTGGFTKMKFSGGK